MNKTIMASLFLSIILLSGCTQGGTKTQTPSGIGLIISSFSADVAMLYPSDSTVLTLKVANNGGRVASDITAQLKFFGDLNLQISEANQVLGNNLTPKDEDIFQFRLSAPSTILMQNVYSPAAEVCYSYSTIAHQDFLLTGGKWRGELPTLESGSTVGPFSTSIEVSSPIKGTSSMKPIKLNVERTGTGFISNGVGITIPVGSSIISYGTKNYLSSVTLKIPKLKYCGVSGTEPCITISDSTPTCPLGISCDLSSGICSDSNSSNCIFEVNEFKCQNDADITYWSCSVDTTLLNQGEALRLIAGNTGLFRLYVNSAMDADSTLEYTGKIRAKYDYKYCIDTKVDFPVSIRVVPEE